MASYPNDSLSHDEDDDWPIATSENGQALSEGEIKERVKSVAKKYLKKIKTLQQNKRRQDTRIERLTRENRSLREKIGVQAAYLDVLCALLGEDMKEKFKGRKGMGILGGDSCPDHIDSIKESISIDDGLGGEMDPLDSTNGIGPVGMTGGGGSVSTPITSMDPTSHHANFSSGLLLDQDHADSYVTGLGDDSQMQVNNLYCIEDISEQDPSSLFIC